MTNLKEKYLEGKKYSRISGALFGIVIVLAFAALFAAWHMMKNAELITAVMWIALAIFIVVFTLLLLVKMPIERKEYWCFEQCKELALEDIKSLIASNVKSTDLLLLRQMS